ncbi:SDR family NAD(P)-dependent oxidoreductase [Actinosynnema mirum]|uniref:SDR family NAD(P)-dependent oxidoreductase n=1 Tax=Actinosynnema mirum TaxID=40567 RepID=UPI001FDEC75E|nr:SDR family NAD(P)-dependent oxidoreductase [Actinosynnema mirum]
MVDNAGIAINAPVELLPTDEWRRQFEVNFFGHVAVTMALLPALHASSGRVVNSSSVGGKVAMPAYGAHAGAKFAMEGMSDALRRELAPHGVTVVVARPGGVRTEMTGHGVHEGRTARRGGGPAHPPPAPARRPGARPARGREPAPPLPEGGLVPRAGRRR